MYKNINSYKRTRKMTRLVRGGRELTRNKRKMKFSINNKSHKTKHIHPIYEIKSERNL